MSGHRTGSKFGSGVAIYQALDQSGIKISQPFFKFPICRKISLISDLSLFSKSSSFFRIRPWEVLSDSLPDENLVSLINSKSPSRDGKLSMLFANDNFS